ncbi:MAG: aminoacyl-tRNA hydrolase, partial [Gemmataceae bacterium]
MKLVVGLGNPGRKYAGTRHNVGFDVVDYLAKSPVAGAFRSKFSAQVAELNEAGRPLLLVKPETFMNLSGRVVREVVDFYKLPLDELLVVCDDINLPLGKLRVRAKGSHGGHNGLRNIQEQLSSIEYARLRIGVDAPELKGDGTVDHVLGRFKPGERDVIEEAVHKAALAALLWANDGLAVCMNRTNGPEEKEKPPKKKAEKNEDTE